MKPGSTVRCSLTATDSWKWFASRLRRRKPRILLRGLPSSSSPRRNHRSYKRTITATTTSALCLLRGSNPQTTTTSKSYVIASSIRHPQRSWPAISRTHVDDDCDLQKTEPQHLHLSARIDRRSTQQKAKNKPQHAMMP